MTIQTFADRFIYGSTITLSQIDTLTTDQELKDLLPTLDSYISQVKSHSVLLNSTRFTYRYIYDICTLDSDARISLIIAAAKDLNNNPMFPNLEIVKELMFGPTTTNLTIYDKDEYNIFVDGIRRVSAALTASKLVNQLATIDEQFKHASAIEKQALADMDRLIKLNSIKTISSGVSSAAEAYVASLYFEIKDFTLDVNESLKCEVYMPAVDYDNLFTRKTSQTSSWVTSFTLIGGDYNTSDIVSLASDTINSMTLNNRSTNILAAPMLSNINSRHEIKFDARLKSDVLAAEIVSIRFTYVDTLTNTTITLPFRWGNNSTLISTGKINSVLLAIQNGKVASTTTTTNASQTPVVLYIKRGPLNTLNQPLDWEGNILPTSTYNPTSKLTFRLSTNMEDSVTVNVPYIISTNQLHTDKERPAQLADLIINELFKVKSSTRTLGTLFRSDSPDYTDPMSAIELICFTARNPETWTILDILEIPPDIYIATGDLKGPVTPFSNNPRSIRVNTLFVSNKILTGNAGVNSGESSSPGFISFKKPKVLSNINDRINRNRFL